MQMWKMKLISPCKTGRQRSTPLGQRMFPYTIGFGDNDATLSDVEWPGRPTIHMVLIDVGTLMICCSLSPMSWHPHLIVPFSLTTPIPPIMGSIPPNDSVSYTTARARFNPYTILLGCRVDVLEYQLLRGQGNMT